MGLDLALGGLVLLAAIRGWLKGFVSQAIRLGGLVAAVYAAGPVRDQAKPYAVSYLPSIRADLVDRIFWWVAAFASYFVIVGLLSLLAAVSRKRQPFGLAEANRSDQFAGLSLGLVKGLISAAFLIGGLEKFGEPYIDKVPYGPAQKQESNAWDWNKRFHPATRIWETAPVQHFVNQIQKMGLKGPSGRPEVETESEPPVQTASRSPKLVIRPDDVPNVDTSGLSPEIAGSVEALKQEFRKLEALSK